MVGLRTALSTSLIVVVLAEMMIGAAGGTGQRLYDAYARNDSVEIFALIIVLGMLGYITNSSLFRLERRLVFWAGQ
jgi:NitT/TauT family transport system permease protein